MFFFFQFTSKERRVVDALRLKFFLINVVFYVCWLPNLINGILVWTMWFQMPVKVIIGVWYTMVRNYIYHIEKLYLLPIKILCY